MFSFYSNSIMICKISGGLKCFSEVGGTAIARCEERKGFRTCFTKFDTGERGKIYEEKKSLNCHNVEFYWLLGGTNL